MDLSHQTFGQKFGSTSNALGRGFNKRNPKNEKKHGITGIHGSRSKRRRPQRSGSDEGPTDPEGLRVLRGDGRSNRRLGIRGGTSTKGKKKTPSVRGAVVPVL